MTFLSLEKFSLKHLYEKYLEITRIFENKTFLYSIAFPNTLCYISHTLPNIDSLYQIGVLDRNFYFASFNLFHSKPETEKDPIILSVAWEQMLNTSAKASIQHAATKVTDRMIGSFPVSSVLIQANCLNPSKQKNTDTNIPMFTQIAGEGFEPTTSGL